MSAVHFKLNMCKCKLLVLLAHSHLSQKNKTNKNRTGLQVPLSYFLFISKEQNDLDCTSQITAQFCKILCCLPKFLQRMVRPWVVQIPFCYPPSLISFYFLSCSLHSGHADFHTTFSWRYIKEIPPRSHSYCFTQTLLGFLHTPLGLLLTHYLPKSLLVQVN